MQSVLPEGHLSSDSKEVVKLSMGVVETLTALVLGLLIASAKSSYDARESEVKQLTAYVILLDTLLAQYGEEGQPARASLRQAVPAVAEEIDMITRFRAAACLASLIALLASKEHAAAAYQVDRLGASTAAYSSGDSIIRLAQEDQTSSIQTPDVPDNGDDSGQSSPPTQSPQ